MKIVPSQGWSPPALQPKESVANFLTKKLKAYADGYGIKGFVVGVSGGIDSAVVSSLCARTGLETICVLIPIKQNSSETDRGQKHVLDLQLKFPNVKTIKKDLSDTYDTMLNEFGAMPSKAPSDLEFLSNANLRSRLRMCTLYYIAGLNSFLVIGTGNKVEDFGVGFFTKYGDGGVDISPIGDLVKSEVYKLGKSLEIIQEIQEAKPTDGLWEDGRTDEDQIGATYDELEWAMDYISKNPNAVSGDPKKVNSRQMEVLKIYNDRHEKNSHKMKPIPIFQIPKGLIF